MFQRTVNNWTHPLFRSNTRYFHGDLIDSNVLATEPGQTPLATASTAYTAFGEPISHAASGAGLPDDPSTLGTRYQYAGAYGYEAGMLSVAGPNTDLPPVTLSHVGARWYQAGIGRFVQRDPIGLVASMNVYAYCEDNPLCAVDPSGFWHWDSDPPWPRIRPVDVPRIIPGAGTAIGGGIRGTRVPKKIMLPGQDPTSFPWAKALQKTLGKSIGVPIRFFAKRVVWPLGIAVDAWDFYWLCLGHGYDPFAALDRYRGTCPKPWW